MAPQPRPIRIEGPLAYVTLTKGYVAKIDAEDAWMVERWSWFALPRPNGNVYAGRGARLRGRKYTILLHRVLISAPPAFDVDHEDGDGLNCRRSNLRLATPTENARNVAVSPRNKLGVKGVFEYRGRFLATIKFDGKSRHLGSFSTIGAAKAAYDAAAADAFGDFARP